MRKMILFGGLMALALVGQARADCAPAYAVKQGDTLSSIAADRLGDAARWSQIYYANPVLQSRAHVDVLQGTVLHIPCPDDCTTGPDATHLLKTNARIRLLTGSRNPPFTDLSWPGNGIMTELVIAAFEDSPETAPYSLTWEHDWTRHLYPMLDSADFDMGFPWFRPDCENEPDNDICVNFHFSDPVVDLVMLLFARTENPMSFVEDADVEGKTLCRPAGHPTYDLDRPDRRWLSEAKITLRQPTTTQACFVLLMAGEVDAVAVNEFLGVQKMFEMGLTQAVVPLTRPLSVEGLHVVISKKNWRGTTHLYRFNAGLAALRKSDRYTTIVSRHLGLFWDQVKG